MSRSHLDNLRSSRTCRTKWTTWEKTRPSPVAIGVRKAPEPNGRLGFPWVDTVYLDDRDGRKSVRAVNVVNVVTQYEHVGTAPAISERFMVPILEALPLQRQRPRNAHVKGKNAHVVRKHLGYEHIPVRFADDVDRFARESLSPFLNFHSPSLFATERVDAKGKLPPRGHAHAAGEAQVAARRA